MQPIRRIVYPIDLKGGNPQSLRYVIRFAETLGAELYLFHVLIDRTRSEFDLIGFPEMEEFDRAMQSEVNSIIRGLPDPEPSRKRIIRYAVRRYPDVARAILDYASERRIDLIAMSPHQRQGKDRFEVDSITERVMRLASQDVLTYGRKSMTVPYSVKRILVPVDFSPYARLALEKARHLAHRMSAGLTILHVVETTVFPGITNEKVVVRARKTDVEARQELKRFYRNTAGPDVPHRYCVLRGRPEERIAACAGEQDAQLIVQGTSGRTGIDYALLGSVAEVTARRAGCPVLTVKPRDRNTSVSRNSAFSSLTGPLV